MLVDNMKVLLASSFSLYLKGSNFHWNTEGPNFLQNHEFLGDFYQDIYSTIDQIAEYIRALDSYAPAGLDQFQGLTIIEDCVVQLLPYDQFAQLLSDNTSLLAYLNNTFTVATVENQQGIANFIAERIDAMQKHNWMLRSILKTSKM